MNLKHGMDTLKNSTPYLHQPKEHEIAMMGPTNQAMRMPERTYTGHKLVMSKQNNNCSTLNYV